MFCPNCGNKVNELDNFCKFCGKKLRDSVKNIENLQPVSQEYQEEYSEGNTNSQEEEIEVQETKEPVVKEVAPETTAEDTEASQENEKIIPLKPFSKIIEDKYETYTDDLNHNNPDEIVVYEIKKHAMALFWACVFSPIFIAYFWLFYVNIPSFIGFIIAVIFLIPIVYPILRYISDRSVITTSNLHISQGVFNVEEICIPLNKIHLVRLRRSFLGRYANYGHLIIEKENSDKEIVYKYIQNPEDIGFILNNPKKYIQKFLK